MTTGILDQHFPNFISEDQIEPALLQKLQHLRDFDALDCYTENAEDLNDDFCSTSWN